MLSIIEILNSYPSTLAPGMTKDKIPKLESIMLDYAAMERDLQQFSAECQKVREEVRLRDDLEYSSKTGSGQVRPARMLGAARGIIFALSSQCGPRIESSGGPPPYHEAHEEFSNNRYQQQFVTEQNNEKKLNPRNNL